MSMLSSGLFRISEAAADPQPRENQRAFVATRRRRGTRPSFATAAGGPIPIDDLFASPEQGISRVSNVLNRFSEIFEAVWSAHNVGVDDQRHHARGNLGILTQLLKLVDSPVSIFGGLMVLDQHHRHVVAFLRIRHAENGPRAGI